MTVRTPGRRIRPASKRPATATPVALVAAMLIAALPACGGGDDSPSKPAPAQTSIKPDDPLVRYQWHLVNTGQRGDPQGTVHAMPGVDINVAPAWKRGIDGKGVTVAVVDGGIELEHEDLRANIVPQLSHNYRTGGSDPTPPDFADDHGTAVAGIIAAARNEVGGVGVAPAARLAGFAFLGAPYTSDVIDALGRGIVDGSIHVSNNSWGPVRFGDDPLPAERKPIMEDVIRKGVDRGREGKGIVYVFAGGNSNIDRLEESAPKTPDLSWSNLYDRPMQSLSVCAVNAHGVASDYSESGSNLLVCAPSNNTKDIMGVTTTRPYNQYTHSFGGTSAAAPMVSGVVALMLQANPKLTWRDIRLILARTARILPTMANDPAAGWIETGARNPHTGQPYRYSTRYGFGLVDADAAVSYAKRFPTVGGSSREFWSQACTGSIREADEDGNGATASGVMERQIEMPCGWKNVEFLEAQIGVEHPNFRALRITLESPLGTKIVLGHEYSRCEAFAERIFGPVSDACSTANFNHHYRTHAVTALDEPAAGNWTLRIEDALGTGQPIRLHGASITIS